MGAQRPKAKQQHAKADNANEGARRIRLAKRRQTAGNRRLRQEVDAAFHAYEPQRSGLTTADMLNHIRERAYHHWVYAAKKVDELPEEEFWLYAKNAKGENVGAPVINPWVEYERACRLDLSDLGVKLVGLDLDERQISLEEAKAQMAVKFLAAVVRDLRLTPDQKAQLRPAIEAHTHLLEATTEKIS